MHGGSPSAQHSAGFQRVWIQLAAGETLTCPALSNLADRRVLQVFLAVSRATDSLGAALTRAKLAATMRGKTTVASAYT